MLQVHRVFKAHPVLPDKVSQDTLVHLATPVQLVNPDIQVYLVIVESQTFPDTPDFRVHQDTVVYLAKQEFQVTREQVVTLEGADTLERRVPLVLLAILGIVVSPATEDSLVFQVLVAIPVK